MHQEDLKSVPKLSIIKVVVSTRGCRVLIHNDNNAVTGIQHINKEAIFHDQTFR